MALRRFLSAHKQTVSPIWYIVLSDLMTNLTLFFLILYAFTRLDVEKRTEMLDALASSASKEIGATAKAKQVLEKFRKQETMDKLTAISKESELEKYVKFNVDEQMIKITLKAPVLFGTGESGLKSEATLILNEITSLLKGLANDVVVEGHTDNVPITSGKYASNWELSSARANSVINYFVKVRRLAAERFICAGYGEYFSIAVNDTPENRALNRRIEINIIK